MGHGIQRPSFEFINGDGTLDAEASRFGAAKCLEVGPATEFRADFMRVGANVKSLAADNTKVNFGGSVGENLMGVNVHKAGFALHDLTLTGEFVEGHAVFFDRADHRRSLVEVAVKFRKGSIDLLASELGNW